MVCEVVGKCWSSASKCWSMTNKPSLTSTSWAPRAHLGMAQGTTAGPPQNWENNWDWHSIDGGDGIGQSL